MNKKMTHVTRADLANAIRARYKAAAGEKRRRILDEFIAATRYHEKSAIRALNSPPVTKVCQRRQRASPLYDEAARAALIVLWEASDRVCGKRLKALLPILLPALERNGHLKLDEAIRPKILSISASTIDRLLRTPRNAKRPRKIGRSRESFPNHDGASRCAPLPTGMSRRPAPWKWTWLVSVFRRPSILSSRSD
jgi:hypothetical protein